MATKTVPTRACKVSQGATSATGHSTAGTESLPELFEVTMPDDALGERTPKGTRLIFRRVDGPEEPDDGEGVVVLDGEGRLHIRMCRRDQPGQPWIAATRSDAYASFDMAGGACRLVGRAVFREARGWRDEQPA